MATLLLFVIYISFIGLGIPDSILGTAWPAIYSELGFAISYAGFISAIVSIGTIFSSLLSARLISVIGANKVTAISTAITAVTLLAYSFTSSIWIMLLLAIPLGFGAGSIDVALNNYVALHCSASQMNFLHCFYGVGVTLSPFVMSMVIESSLGWRGGYRIAFGIQLAIALLAFCTLGVWSKVEHNKDEQVEKERKPLSIIKTFQVPGVKLTCALFFLATAIEFTCGNWGSTYLVEGVGITKNRAAQIMMGYYIGITLSRLISGFLSHRLKSWTLIWIGLFIMGTALITVLFGLTSTIVSEIGIFLIGLGIGPIFPNFTHLTPKHFGQELSQSIIGVQMASCNLGIMLSPVICGLLGQVISIKIFPLYTLALFAILITIVIIVNHFFKKQTMYIYHSKK